MQNTLDTEKPHLGRNFVYKQTAGLSLNLVQYLCIS